MTAPRACSAVVGLLLLTQVGCSTTQGAATGVPEPAAASTPAPAATPSPEVPTAVSPADHEDDYEAPVDELVDHADHLDLARLPPAKRAALEQELARRGAVGEGLWTAYGERLGAPPQVRSLVVQELAFVLLAARADQVAEAVARTGGLEPALAEVGPDAAGVEVTEAGDCVAVTWSGDEFSRSYGATVGTRDSGTVRERLQRVRVAGPGERACDGSPVSLSPDADRALG